MNITIQKQADEETYRANPAVANSDLSLLKESPILYKRVKLDAQPSERTSSGFAIGRLLDCKLLTPDLFDERFYAKPDGLDAPSSPQQRGFFEEVAVQEGWASPEQMLDEDRSPSLSDIYLSHYKRGNMADETVRTKAVDLFESLRPYADWVLACGERTPYTQAQADQNAKCEMAMLANPLARRLMRFLPLQHDAFNQVALFWDEQIAFGQTVQMKGLIDRLVFDHAERKVYLIDLKTTAHGLDSYAFTFNKWDYDRQLYHYLVGLQLYLDSRPDLRDYTIVPVHVVVTTKANPECRVFMIPELFLTRGRQKRTALILDLAHHLKAGDWNVTRTAVKNGGFDTFSKYEVEHIMNLPL